MKILNQSRNVLINSMIILRDEQKTMSKSTNRHYLIRKELTRLSRQLLSVDLNNPIHKG